MTVNAHRLAQLMPDRGGRQHLKVMQLLAAVEGDGSTSISEALVTSVRRIRRGTTAVVITPSLDRSWVKPLATLKTRGVACVVITMDVPSFERRVQEEERRKAGFLAVDEAIPEPSATAQQWRALRHALAEFDIAVYRAGPTQPLSEALAS